MAKTGEQYRPIGSLVEITKCLENEAFLFALGMGLNCSPIKEMLILAYKTNENLIQIFII